MQEQSFFEQEIATKSKEELYRDPNYVTLYRFENTSIPYDESREGIVSIKSEVGNWYTDNLADLKTYTVARIKGKRGGKFVLVRVKLSKLQEFDATSLSTTENMDIEKGNYVIPPSEVEASRIEIEAPFLDRWDGRNNIPFADWKIIEQFVNEHLRDEAIIANL